MRSFSYFLFENFDPEQQRENPQNPRKFLNASVDPVLTRIAHGCGGFPADVATPLIQGGIVREEGGMLLFDTPIFLREDAPVLRETMARKAKGLVEHLLPAVPELRACCRELDSGFSVEIHLYHLLCGMVFDGMFFDYLSRRGAVATSRLHSSGLDYLAVIYENCGELDGFSKGLLCSYNRFTDGSWALQSFGDAEGDRFDFYRFGRLLELGKLPSRYGSVRDLFEKYPKEKLLTQVRHLVELGECEPEAMALLTEFGYVTNGALSVPVYGGAALTAAEGMEKILEERLGDAFVQALSDVPDITAKRHGVSQGEIANELYHILFGSVNEELATRGIAAQPPRIDGQGRFLRCIQMR